MRHSREIPDRDLELYHRQAISKAARKKLDGRVAQRGRVIIVPDVRAKALKHQEDEVKKANGLTRRYWRQNKIRSWPASKLRKKLGKD